tara:strand:- start:85 stop:336 length:252 start_codon:yes stop_codon:yes gene_type:complete
MHSVIDPLLTLQLVGAVLIVLTLPDNSESPPSEQTSIPADREPFQLSDGNKDVADCNQQSPQILQGRHQRDNQGRTNPSAWIV